MKYFSLILILTFLLSSCRDYRTQFDLILIETGTDIPVPDARIVIFGEKFSGNLDFLSQPLDTIFTDNQGYAEYYHNEEFDYTNFTITKDGYWPISLQDERGQLVSGENMSYEFNMSGFAYFVSMSSKICQVKH